MKREEKNAQTRKRIVDAAIHEFSQKGYDGASINAVCAGKEFSKGIIYHYFKDKDELYLLCVRLCFDALTAYLQQAEKAPASSATARLEAYFRTRSQFFVESPEYLGIFLNAVCDPPKHLMEQISVCRRGFDEFNRSELTALLHCEPLRAGLSMDTLVEDLRLYFDYFNFRFRADLRSGAPAEELLQKHEERCRRQMDLLLYGALEGSHGRT